MNQLKDIKEENIASHIYLLRGYNVILDFDLAELYEVQTKNLNLAVKRNISRFPKDFMFQLTKTEWACLRLQFETSKGRGGTRYLPYAFTEQGVAMLSGILNSERAIKVNIAIMRAFVQLRKLIYSHKDLAEQLNQIEKKYDEQFKWVFEALRKLIQKEVKPRKRIGYKYYDEGTETG